MGTWRGTAPEVKLGAGGGGWTQLHSASSSPVGETEAHSAEPLSLLPPDICAFCHKAVGPREPTVEAMRKQYHANCFTCRTCHQLLAGQRYYQKDGRPMCDACYQVPVLPRGQPAPSGWWQEMLSLRSWCVTVCVCVPVKTSGHAGEMRQVPGADRGAHRPCPGQGLPPRLLLLRRLRPGHRR